MRRIRRTKRASLRITAGPVEQLAGFVGIRLCVDTVNHQHVGPKFLKQLRIIGDGGEQDVACLPRISSVCPVINFRLAWNIDLWIAQLRDIDATL